jgi:hypothetical protein
VVGLIGGNRAANDRLDSFFAYDQLVQDPAKTAREVWVNGPYAYYNADKYNPQNEPDLLAPYTYLSTGQPWKTTDVVHAAFTLIRRRAGGTAGRVGPGPRRSVCAAARVRLPPASRTGRGHRPRPVRPVSPTASAGRRGRRTRGDRTRSDRGRDGPKGATWSTGQGGAASRGSAGR